MIPVLVTTEYRGVFFGHINPEDIGNTTLTLVDARMCIYWSADVKGFMGLASKGPTPTCRIGHPATITLHKITSVAAVTPDAAAEWRKGHWSE